MSAADRAFQRAHECIDEIRAALAKTNDGEAIGDVCTAVEAYDKWWEGETGGHSPFHGDPS